MLWVHAAVVGLLVGTRAVFTALAVLDVRHAGSAVREGRDWLVDRLGIDDPEELLAYHRATTGLSELRSWVGLGAVLLLVYGFLPEIVTLLDATGLGPIARGVAFFLGATVLLRALALPFDAVETFVIEEMFGFNEQTVGLWVRDRLVGLAVGLVLVGVLAAALLAAITALPRLWWLAGVGLFVTFALVMQVIYPRVIAPLFYEFEPVEGGDLRDAVEDVFGRAGFACEQVYEMDASSRSTHSNAYFVGFGRTKRVVLFDTLIEQMDLPEIQAVLAHELAHWKRAHVWKKLAAGTVRVAVVLAVLQYLVAVDWFGAAFGVGGAAYATLAVGALIVAPLNRLAAPVENRLSLRFEREADAFAVDVMGDGDGLVGALSRLTSENLSNPFPHPWYALFHYTHPPVPERIRTIEEQTADAAEPAAGD